MLVDLDYFFAQCEELRNSVLKDKPVVIGVYSGRTEDSGAVSTANYQARRLGIRSGMPIFQAKKKLSGIDAVFLPVDHAYYDQVSEKVMELLRPHADSFEQAGIDEAYLDITETSMRDFDKAGEIARKIKDEMKETIGLTCSIGIGPNKLIAKIAADSKKPDGLIIVRVDEASSFLKPLPVDRLLGVGAKTRDQMLALDIKTMGDLATYDVSKLMETFGKTLGSYFHRAASGIDGESVHERHEADSISRIATLKENTRDLVYILDKTNQLCIQVWEQLVQRKMRFKTVGAIAIMADMSVLSRSKTLSESANGLNVLNDLVKMLFEKLLSDTNIKIRRVGIRVSNLEKEQEIQRQITSFFNHQ